MSAFTCTIHDVETRANFAGDSRPRSGVENYRLARAIAADLPECPIIFKSDWGNVVFNGDDDDEPELF